MQPAQTLLNLSAYARNVSDIGRYLLNIQRAKDTFTTVSITSQMPGWTSSGGTSASASSGGTAGPYGAGTAGPYGAAPGGYVTGSPYGPGGGYSPGVTVGSPDQAAPAITMIDFTAVGQLTQKFQFVPPVFAGAGSTDTSGGGGASPYGAAGYPGGGPAGPYGPGVGPGGGGNGGGGNGGGGNGGAS
jgi:hypothetical protein